MNKLVEFAGDMLAFLMAEKPAFELESKVYERDAIAEAHALRPDEESTEDLG